MAREPHPWRALIVLYAASGAAGLIQEVAWARLLGQSLGTSLHALTAVLVAFLGGLGLGSAWAARRAGRSPAPLRAYAWLELWLAVCAVAAPAFALALPPLLERLGPRLPGEATLAAARLALAIAALAPATVAMGATFPYLVREATAGRGAAPGAAVPVLYGANTLGAALGALLGSFALLPCLGTRATFLVAGGINLAVGAAALILDRRRAPLAARAAAGSPPAAGVDADALPGAPWRPARAALLAALSSGAIGSLLQIGWTRVAALAFGSSVYALGITLAAYILGLGIGPFAVRRRLLRTGAASKTAALSCAALGAASLLLVPALGDLPLAAAALSGRLGHDPLGMIALQFLLLAALLLLPSIAQGSVFPALAALPGGSPGGAGRSGGAERAAGLVYAASTWGSVGGALLAGFLLVPLLGTRGTLLAASVAALLLASALLLLRPSGRRALWGAAGLALAAPLLGALAARWSWDPSVVASGGSLYGPVYRAAFGEAGRLREAMRRRGDILFYADGAAGLVTVRRSPAGTLSLQINGKTEASTGADMATQLLAAHLPLILRPGARDALVIGLASGITLGAAEKHPLAALEAIEIVPEVRGAARLFDPFNGRALDDPRLTLAIDDARSRLLVRRERFDVIASQPSNPWVAGVANLFTVEFYRLARNRLRPGGIFCQWVQAYRLDPRDLRGIVRSFLTAFPDATLWEESAGGGDYFLLGGDGPLRLDPRRLLDEALQPIWDDLRRGGVEGPADLLARFVAGPQGLRAFAADATPHTDDDLYLEARAPLALFRDTLGAATAALRSHREPVQALLPDDFAVRQPGLAQALGEAVRRRDQRLELAESLKAADLWALRDPFLAAGIEALRSGLWTEAIRALSRAAADHPESAACHLLLGEAYRAAGLEEAAAVAYRQAVLQDPTLAPAWNALGRYLAGRGAWDQARQAFERALEQAPGMAAACNNLGTALLRSGDAQGAERALREALAADPRLAAARANLGLVLKRRGDAAGAEEAYRTALELDPLDADARYNLAMLLAETGRHEAARQELRRLLAAGARDALAAEALRRLQAGDATGGPNAAPR